jgi:hypothetical protein
MKKKKTLQFCYTFDYISCTEDTEIQFQFDKQVEALKKVKAVVIPQHSNSPSLHHKLQRSRASRGEPLPVQA